MNLTPETRLVLINQYRLLAKLDPEAKEECVRAIDVLQSGYEAEYDNLSLRLTENPMSREECGEVRDILEMHTELRWAYEDLKDKSAVAERDIAFQGFDGNNETQALGYARFLIDGGRWKELADSGDGLNSHTQVMDMYRRMLPVWRRCVETRHRELPTTDRHNLLSVEEILEICAERVHPENRGAAE